MRTRMHLYGLGLAVGACATAALASDPWADHVTSFDLAGGNPSHGDVSATLGAPERFTGEGVFPSVVSMFNPAFGTDELVQIGAGGWLTVEFDEPITNDPSHLYGVDLIIFGNAGFADFDFPNGQNGSPAVLFGGDPMRVSVSADGTTFVPLADTTEGLFPAQGYLDSGPFDDHPGSLLTDFTRPMNPALTLNSFDGLSYADSLALYDGSGGGTPIDIAASGLGTIRFVRVEPIGDVTLEIEAFATVPEPATLLLAALGLGALSRRRR